MFLKERDHSIRNTLIKLAAIALAALTVVAGVGAYDRSSTERGRKLVGVSVLRAAMQCYALEGRYPADVEYLRSHYGLSANEKKYSIHYEFIGGNIMPDVTVTVKTQFEE